MPLNASQLQDIQGAQSMLKGHLDTINKHLKLQNDPIESVIDFEELSESTIDPSYRNYLATRIYDNYVSTVARFLYYQLDYTDDTRKYAPIYIEEFQNRWWARELTFEFVEAEASWKMNSGRVFFRDGALVIQVPPAKFNYNAYDTVYKGMEVVLDDDIGEGMVAKYKVSAEQAKEEFTKLEAKLKQLMNENYHFDFDFERYWINGHVQLISQEYRLREPLLSVQYASRLAYLIEDYVKSFPVGLTHLNEMVPTRKICLMFGSVQNQQAQYDLYVNNGALVLKVPESKFCYNVGGIGERGNASIQHLVDAYMTSKPKPVEQGPSPAELERLAKRKQREEEAARKKQERANALAEAKQRYESDGATPQEPQQQTAPLQVEQPSAPVLPPTAPVYYPPQRQPVYHQVPQPPQQAPPQMYDPYPQVQEYIAPPQYHNPGPIYAVQPPQETYAPTQDFSDSFTSHVTVSSPSSSSSYRPSYSSSSSRSSSSSSSSSSSGSGKVSKSELGKIYGKIKFVTSGQDYKVKIVDAFPDLKVKKVDAFANKAGLWKIVDAFPDYKIKIVDAFPDFKVKYVSAFPGVN